MVQLLQALASVAFGLSCLLFVLRHRTEIGRLLGSLARRGGEIGSPIGTVRLLGEDESAERTGQLEGVQRRMTGAGGEGLVEDEVEGANR